MRIGLDIGSTTVKCIVLDRHDEIIYQSYQRHYSQITESAAGLLRRLAKELPGVKTAGLAISGSAGMGLAESCGIPFVQEVFGTRIAAARHLPEADVIIELGGEDAKILFLTGGLEVRMNGSCAGGTGAFMDQMATLLEITLDEMDELAGGAEREYTIASRCGVFAKSDIQPLLNQGARKEDVAASIFGAVVSQTIAGLAQGRPIKGRVIYLGGPLTFLPRLRASFDKSLGTAGLCPEHSLYYVALGAAYSAEEQLDLAEAVTRLENYGKTETYAFMQPLFADEEEYRAFCRRHEKASVAFHEPTAETKAAYFGIDAGSTTVKMVMTDEEGRILCSSYQTNNGNPVDLVRRFLMDFYEKWPQTAIKGSAVTGYGEDIIRRAFRVDYGIVETVAHYKAAARFMPEVDFIIDIGGQDIKCFKIKNGTIDNIFLNEACSSGCGSFLQTFANALGYSTGDFARLGLFGRKPVDLGSRCTVFMNSLVKQAQKDGASVENISAGLSISVVKNALYKVIRPTASEPVGQHIVVQGGTFLNDGVLRAFEQELNTQVVRPVIAGLMGAYGAALYATERKKSGGPDSRPSAAGDSVAGPSAAETSAAGDSAAGASAGEAAEGKRGLLDINELREFSHQTASANCGLCSNRCRLTVNTFSGGRRYIGGNRCSRPVTSKAEDQSLNLYEYKRQVLENYRQKAAGKYSPVEEYHLFSDITVGIPMGLNMYELLPFWQEFFNFLGYRVIVSPPSSRELYLTGQGSIPSDTVCYPAKLMHGHVQYLLEQGVKAVFYPCMTYNIDEGLGDNHYNCPVVAYYPEVIAANEPGIGKTKFIYDYLGLHERKEFPLKIWQILWEKLDHKLTYQKVKTACGRAFQELAVYRRDIEEKGGEILDRARREGRQIIVLSGRPYHADGEISHGIDQLIAGFGVALVTEDAVSPLAEKLPGTVLNQWTYHSRLYAAAHYTAAKPDMNLVQLVSFGCGVDAITTDEVRDILEERGKIYTQIKIDEIANLGAVRIRLRSLLAAVGGERRDD